MLSLFDFFSGRKTSAKTSRKSRPSDTRLCPGCPANISPKTLDLPKMKLPDAQKQKSSADSKVVSVVNMKDYKKNHKSDPNTLF